MKVWLNGQIIPAEQARISIFDRGLTCGDSLFETLRIAGGRPYLWPHHWDRFCTGAHHLGLPLPEACRQLTQALESLANANNLSEAAARITLTRGEGPRGYSRRGAGPPNIFVSLSPLPPTPGNHPAPCRIGISRHRLPDVPIPMRLAKHSNRLLHVLARAEAEEQGWDEILLQNGRGDLAEASAANLFWIGTDASSLGTPPLESGALPGVTRAWVIRWAGLNRIPLTETPITPRELATVPGVFLTQSTRGIVPVSELAGAPFGIPKLLHQLDCAYQAELDRFRKSGTSTS